eukprot:TRINITY_DN13901_c0_g1_i1.p1 TRINITY_DN13901_c0_g1~~TRINITY_DN13901_c0_g1_i1.p1  ORF type:complete len:573 (-),score=155.78 TRINITY_DN13901_c0_g1_i1:54-1742(-)
MEPIVSMKSLPVVVTIAQKNLKRTLPRPAHISDVIDDLKCEGKVLVGALVDGYARSLGHQLAHSATIEPVFIDSADGKSIYKRTMSFILMMAASYEFQEKILFTIKHAVKNGYMCWLDHGKTKATEEIANRLKERMKKIMEMNIPINTIKLSREDALEYFSKRNRPYTMSYIEAGNTVEVPVHECNGYMDLYFRSHFPATGTHPVFDIKAQGDGLILCFCNFDDPFTIGEIEDNPILRKIYKEATEEARLLKVSCCGDLNQKVLDGKSVVVMSLAEQIQMKRIVEVAKQIAERKDSVKLVLIAGPSSSGKTTFASKLSLQLEINGIIPVVLSVDNYYKAKKDIPLDSEGKPDLESPNSLRIDRLNQDLISLIEGKETDTPLYDFPTSAPKTATKKIKLPKDGVIVMEGIHCLNDIMTPLVPRDKKFKIFIAPLSPISMDETNFLSNAVNRLARRMVRDYRTRGCSASDTLDMWPGVMKGEELYIFPFMQTADAVYNTALEYEMAVLKDHCIPLLRTIKPRMPFYNSAMDLVFLLDCFHSVQDYTVPPDSLLREFFGQSFFEE